MVPHVAVLVVHQAIPQRGWHVQPWTPGSALGGSRVGVEGRSRKALLGSHSANSWIDRHPLPLAGRDRFMLPNELTQVPTCHAAQHLRTLRRQKHCVCRRLTLSRHVRQHPPCRHATSMACRRRWSRAQAFKRPPGVGPRGVSRRTRVRGFGAAVVVRRHPTPATGGRTAFRSANIACREPAGPTNDRAFRCHVAASVLRRARDHSALPWRSSQAAIPE